MKYKSWTYEEDKLILKLGNTDELRKALKYKSKPHITARSNTLRREGATIESLEYEENFIRTGYKNLSQRAMAKSLKISEGRMNQRIRSMKPGIKNEKEITLAKEEIETLKCKNNKEIMKELNLDDYEVAVRRAILSERKRKEQTKKKAKKAMKSYHLQKDEKVKMKILKYKKAPKESIALKEIHKKQYKNGKEYFIKQPISPTITKTFQGRLIQETKNHITLKNERGLRESFLKIDFMTGDSKIKLI